MERVMEGVGERGGEGERGERRRETDGEGEREG